ncbi:hypothetical protein DAPPUDRAFT_260029 [Daphnia pulex]|uniref:Uncharacterized protein n=1 Tax=Daphnia pulex TaxID=6669 RepID=E9HIC6_DAPPU|nr:hypothetical protein DAPPUDRAFT_260029 [Daphnia pulex]|eukprot:EFX68519.1 hypothetical protein DAPPUDRAFT_260029 [Daphnia pulex]
MNSENVNKHNKNGDTALHVAIQDKFKTAIKELLKHKDVDVNLKDNDNYTVLHFATLWKDIPIDLFKKILEKTTDVNAQDDEGDTALQHLAILCESKTAVNILLKRKDVDVSLNNKNEDTAFDLCRKWKDIPDNIFKIISDKTADIQAQ